MDERIEALQAGNKGTGGRMAIGALNVVINTIRQLVAMLRDVLARTVGVVGNIIKNPVAFLGNLMEPASTRLEATTDVSFIHDRELGVGNGNLLLGCSTRSRSE